MHPSERDILLLLYDAIAGSWVMRTIVDPLLFRDIRSFRMSCPDAVSKFPVGSSASITAGFPTIARAIATRCCCPPESWLGLWVIRSDSPTRSRAAIADLFRVDLSTPRKISGISTFSKAVRRRKRLKF